MKKEVFELIKYRLEEAEDSIKEAEVNSPVLSYGLPFPSKRFLTSCISSPMSLKWR